MEWHLEQKERVSTYQPKRPDIPNDHRCPEGDNACTNKVPPPPGLEPFISADSVWSFGSPYDWIAVLSVACVAFLLATRRPS